MQNLKALPTTVGEIARVNEIVDGRMDNGKLDTYVAPCQ